ncbi:hypothetical protein AB4233_06555 [Vibrio sp. 10N.286.45.F3]|uniref:hypothetical protein n=1 Tax=unclassified Vibrio TaxID=2614977 RepID=UPI0018E48CB4|nr:hypothetical protein [Vibrio sp. 10N.261.45.A1]
MNLFHDKKFNKATCTLLVQVAFSFLATIPQDQPTDTTLKKRFKRQRLADQ